MWRVTSDAMRCDAITLRGVVDEIGVDASGDTRPGLWFKRPVALARRSDKPTGGSWEDHFHGATQAASHRGASAECEALHRWTVKSFALASRH